MYGSIKFLKMCTSASSIDGHVAFISIKVLYKMYAKYHEISVEDMIAVNINRE